MIISNKAMMYANQILFETWEDGEHDTTSKHG
jgi:hypothetical protein